MTTTGYGDIGPTHMREEVLFKCTASRPFMSVPQLAVMSDRRGTDLSRLSCQSCQLSVLSFRLEFLEFFLCLVCVCIINHLVSRNSSTLRFSHQNHKSHSTCIFLYKPLAHFYKGYYDCTGAIGWRHVRLYYWYLVELSVYLKVWHKLHLNHFDNSSDSSLQ